MGIRATIFGAVLTLSAPLAARQKTDVIVLANGDRITGEIKSLNAGVLRVDLDYVDGAISVQWLKVRRITSNQLFIVQAQDGSLYTGTLASAALEPDKIEVADPTNTKTVIEHYRVVRMEETAESFFRRWSGDINWGIVFSKGNSATQYTLGSEIEYRRE